MKQIFVLIMTFFFLLNYQNCSPVHEGNFDNLGSFSLPPFSSELAQAFNQDCMSCHAGELSSPERLALAYSGGVPWVDFSDLENSLVLRSVRKEGGADPMPPGSMDPWAASDALQAWLLSIDTTPPPPDDGGGGGEEDEDAPPMDLGPATYANVSSVIQTYCISCHTGASPTGGIRLDSYENVRAQLNFETLSHPLLISVANQSMPPADAPLAMPVSVRRGFEDLLLDWIAAGAPNN